RNPFGQGARIEAAADQGGVDNEGQTRSNREGRAFFCLKQHLDRGWRKAKLAQTAVAFNAINVLLAVIGIGAAAVRRGEGTLRDQIADLALGNAGQKSELAHAHEATFDNLFVEMMFVDIRYLDGQMAGGRRSIYYVAGT